MLNIIALIGLIVAAVWLYQSWKSRADMRRFFGLARLGSYVPEDHNVEQTRHRHIVSMGTVVEPSDALPTYFKWKERVLVPVRDQGKCASCWAFAVSDCVADRLSIATGGQLRESLSVQELMSCFSPKLFHCKRGGIPELAYQYVISHGLRREKDYPYVQLADPKVPSCQEASSLLDLLDYLVTNPMRAEENKDKTYGREGTVKNLCFNLLSTPRGSETYEKKLRENIENMKTEIFLHGPIVGTMFVHKDLYQYEGKTVYEHSPSSPMMGGHAIEIFGWCDAGQNTKEPGFQSGYWICRNSWGLKWPRSLPYGLMYIKMGSNESGIESRASSVVPLLNSTTQLLRNGTVKERLCYDSYEKYANDPERVNFLLKDSAKEQFA